MQHPLQWVPYFSIIETAQDTHQMKNPGSLAHVTHRPLEARPIFQVDITGTHHMKRQEK